MADAILTPSADTAPPLDTVLLCITQTVERDYEQRGVFPKLRTRSAFAHSGSSALHCLTQAGAESVLLDAVAREAGVRQGLRSAYRAHIKTVRTAIAEAQERPSLLAASTPHCSYKAKHAERWRGTKAQLKAHGIALEGPWPREPGGKTRWAQATDARGYKVSITRFSAIWPDLYEAHITIPYAVWGPKDEAKPTECAGALARRNLSAMPKSEEEFRAQVVDSMRMMLRLSLESQTKPATWHGYLLDEDALEEIHAGFDAVVDAVMEAKVHFDGKRHSEIEQRHRAQIAAADQAFRARLEELVRPNPELLDGGQQ